MGFDTIRWARNAQAGSLAAKLLLLTVATYADNRGRCFPKQSRLAKDTGLGHTAIVEAFKRLESAGLLTRQRQHSKRGYRIEDLITLNLSLLPPDGNRTASLLPPDVRTPRGKPTSAKWHANRTAIRTANKGSVRASPPAVSSKLSKVEEEAIKLWNLLAAERGLAGVSDMSDGRRDRLAAALKVIGLDGWRKALDQIRCTPFLTGGGPRGWRVTFDFLLIQDNRLKITEKNYEANRVRPSAGSAGRRGRGGSSSDVIDAVEEIARRLEDAGHSGHGSGVRRARPSPVGK